MYVCKHYIMQHLKLRINMNENSIILSNLQLYLTRHFYYALHNYFFYIFTLLIFCMIIKPPPDTQI